jgi:hypothetical protein
MVPSPHLCDTVAALYERRGGKSPFTSRLRLAIAWQAILSPHMGKGGKDRRSEFQLLKLTISEYCCLKNPRRLIKLVGYGTMASRLHGIPVDAASFHAIMRDRVEKIILFSYR